MKKNTSSVQSKWLTWFDKYALFVLGLFLLAFIPLYPKIPLFSPIEQYIVRVRLEDFFVALAAGVWSVQWFRKKVTFAHPIVSLMIGYFMIAVASVFSAFFITQSVPLQPLHMGKTLLHLFRYVEYFSVFIILFSSIKTKKQVYIALGVMAATLVAVAAYGYGQRYYYWPVYSTMNREFSKGVRLYLTEHARVQSTFAGHYDLGAYLVLVLPFILALAIRAKNRWQKLFLHLIHWTGIWLLVESAARTSFVAYLVGLTIVVCMTSWREKSLFKRLAGIFTRELYLGLMIGVTIMFYGDAIYERFLQILDAYPNVKQQYHDANAKRKELVEDPMVALSFLNIFPKATLPENAISTDQAVQIIVSSDTRPTPVTPSDVYVDIPDLVAVSTTSAEGVESTVYVERPRVFSENAIKHGLSLAIRLDALWPQAINGFKKNPLLGSGYATLNKQGYQQFTEADSTDNNFLRTLGETGVLGFVSFYGAIFAAIWLASRFLRSDDELLVTLAIAYIAGSVGLLINATYIDVYAASKVAFSYWAVTGIVMAFGHLSREGSTAQKSLDDVLGSFTQKIQRQTLKTAKKPRTDHK